MDADELEVLRLTNEIRSTGAVCGDEEMPPVPPLAPNDTVAAVARAHSQDMGDNGYFSHFDRDGYGNSFRLLDAGLSFSSFAENIAAGYSTPQSVVTGWLNSPGHCKNLLRDRNTQIGIGHAIVDTGYRHYWTQIFIKPN